ncbi:MAG: hypothetical protein IJ419_08300 [Agathobacter sp.]|nr:hypothetical protein [Agathobacter sp.]
MSDNFLKIVEIADYNWENPEDINIKWFGKECDTLHKILNKLYPDCDIDKLAFLFQCYDYLENQIAPFLPADGNWQFKCRWILKQYFESLVGGIPDQLGEDQLDPTYITRKWNEPDYGTTDEWLEYVETMYNMYRNGPEEKYLKVINGMYRLQQNFMDNRKD